VQTTENTGFFQFWLRSIANHYMKADIEEVVFLITLSGLNQI